MTDRYLITVQALITLALLAFSIFMYQVVGGAGADSVGTLIVGAVITHWFKESAQIARNSKTVEIEGEEVNVQEADR